MWRSSVWPASISARLACEHLKEGGALVLPGAQPATKGTPTMAGYGMAKVSCTTSKEKRVGLTFFVGFLNKEGKGYKNIIFIPPARLLCTSWCGASPATGPESRRTACAWPSSPTLSTHP